MAILSCVLDWLNTGIPWRDLSERYGPWKSVYTRFRRWSLQGVWKHVFEELIAGDIIGRECPDAGQHHNQGPPAWQRRKKEGDEALGRIENLYAQPLNAVQSVFFPPYRVDFSCNPSGLLRKISLSDEKNTRLSGIPRL